MLMLKAEVASDLLAIWESMCKCCSGPDSLVKMEIFLSRSDEEVFMG